MPPDPPSVELLARYRAGNPDAATLLFERYVERLTRLARTRLSPRLAARTDPEDIVLSAWRSFFIAAREGRFDLQRSGDLWRLLVAITLRKVYRQARHHSADKRAVALEATGNRVDPQFAPDREPTPDEAAALHDELEWLMGRLSPFARRVLELRLQGELLAEIAADTGRAERSVRRALADIRELLARRQAEAEHD